MECLILLVARILLSGLLSLAALILLALPAIIAATTYWGDD